VFCERFALAAVRTQVGTKEGAAVCLIEQNSIPVMRKMRSLEYLQAMRAEVNHALICNGSGRTHGKVGHRGHSGNRATEHLGLRSQSEPVVQGTALVGLEVREANVAQGAWIEQALDLGAHGIKESRVTSVNEGGVRIA